MSRSQTITRRQVCQSPQRLQLIIGQQSRMDETTVKNCMSHVLVAFLVLISGALLSVTSAQTAVEPLATLQTDHPRLLFSVQDQQRVQDLAKTDALLARLIKQNHINAIDMLGKPSIRYEIPDGKRLLAQSRECIRRVMTMAMAHRLTGDSRFADGAIQEMLVAAKFKDWNPSHFLDTAEMTTGLAIGYDWLYPVIKPADRQTIREAIVNLGLNEGKKVYAAGGWWTERDNNWNQVCNGGMILGALAIGDEERELADEIVTSALKSIPHGTSVYEPSGAYPEGPSYWQYGTSYTGLTIKGLNTALETDFGMRFAPGLGETGWFRIHTIGPTDSYFNYADCGVQSRLASTMFFLADVYGQPTFAAWHRERLAKKLAAGERLEPRRLDRFFPLEIAWYDPRPSHAELPLDAIFNSQQDVVTMRSRWGDPNAIYVGFKGGDNQTNHGHLDIGSFVLDAQGVRWALDLGADNYNLPGFFGGQRWQYYRLINHSHNTIVINDQIQEPKAKCPIVSFHSRPNRCGAIVDMTDAYKDQAGSAWRGIEFVQRRAVHVRDEIVGSSGDVRWAMVTGAEIKLAGQKALLEQDGRTLEAEILVPKDVKFETLPNLPATPAEKQNEGTHILAARIPAGAPRRIEISVLLQPIDKRQNLVKVQPRPLREWPRF